MNEVKNITGTLIDVENIMVHEIDSTGESVPISPKKSVKKCFNFETENLYVKYIEFGKYRIGIIEDNDHKVLGIKSVEVVKRLYSDEQLSKKFNYWDVEQYYE